MGVVNAIIAIVEMIPTVNNFADKLFMKA